MTFRSLLLAGLIVLLFLFIYRLKKIKSQIKQNIILSVSMLFLLFFTVELIFSFYPYCTNASASYMSRLWFHYYWNKNEDGFRDIDFGQMNASGKKRIYFIGDSFTEGHGIKNPKDRTSDIIRERLKVKYDYNIFNMGRNGSNTIDEIKILFTAPILPDIVVLTHISNDVDYLDEFNENFFDGFTEIKILRDGEAFQRISEHSFFINYIYHTIHQTYLKYSNQDYSDQKMIKMAKKLKNVTLTEEDIMKRSEKFMKLMNSENDTANNGNSITMQDQILRIPAAFDHHINTLFSLDSTLKTKSCKLIILIYPNLGDENIDFNTLNSKMCAVLKSKNITAIDLYPLCKQLPQSKRIVNNMNFHASEQLNKIVADSLMVHLIPVL